MTHPGDVRSEPVAAHPLETVGPAPEARPLAEAAPDNCERSAAERASDAEQRLRNVAEHSTAGRAEAENRLAELNARVGEERRRFEERLKSAEAGYKAALHQASVEICHLEQKLGASETRLAAAGQEATMLRQQISAAEARAEAAEAKSAALHQEITNVQRQAREAEERASAAERRAVAARQLIEQAREALAPEEEAAVEADAALAPAVARHSGPPARRPEGAWRRAAAFGLLAGRRGFRPRVVAAGGAAVLGLVGGLLLLDPRDSASSTSTVHEVAQTASPVEVAPVRVVSIVPAPPAAAVPEPERPETGQPSPAQATPVEPAHDTELGKASPLRDEISDLPPSEPSNGTERARAQAAPIPPGVLPRPSSTKPRQATRRSPRAPCSFADLPCHLSRL